ncbi:MAG TPA: lysylphosphatidylglycerol synthase transmembrane domain-containing protein [Acidimicrobiales bacterium]|nr:lysylphosphatidylglycerol synthase transmembrane domain-containing protein [Acidimicrobiales bacterium]
MSGRSGSDIGAGRALGDPEPASGSAVPDRGGPDRGGEAAHGDAAHDSSLSLAHDRPDDGRTRRRARIFLGLRMAASATMLGFLLTRFDLSVLNPIRQVSSWTWVIGGLAVTLAAVVLATLRWQRVLRALDMPSDLHTLLNHVLAGVFVSNFLPSTVGGDVLRVARLSAGNGHRPESFASVVLERLTGFVVLPLITLVALVGNPTLLHMGTATRLALALSLGTLAVLAVILLVACNSRLGARLAGRANWLSFLRAIHLGLDRMRRHPADAASVLVAAFAYQLLIVLAAWAAGHALGLNMGWSAAMAFVPIVAIAQVLPLSVNGLGLREGALVLLLAPLGVPTGQAVALGLMLYGMNLAVSLLGAPAFAVGSRPVRAAV